MQKLPRMQHREKKNSEKDLQFQKTMVEYKNTEAKQGLAGAVAYTCNSSTLGGSRGRITRSGVQDQPDHTVKPRLY